MLPVSKSACAARRSLVDWVDDAGVMGACPCKGLRSSLKTNNESNSLGFVECTAATIESDGKVPMSGISDMSVWLRHSASTSEISGRKIGGGCNALRHVGIILLVLSNKSVEVSTTSNASVKCTSEFSIHSGDCELVGLHVSTCIGTTNESIVTVCTNVPSYGAGGGRPLLAALMVVLLANVVLSSPGPYRGLLVLFRLNPPYLEFPWHFFRGHPPGWVGGNHSGPRR